MKKFILSAIIGAALLTSCGGEEKKENEENTASTESTSEDHSSNSADDAAPAMEASTMGNWNAEDKAKADAAMAAAEADLAVFGDKKDAFIDCYLVKLENAYSSYASADSDIQGCSSIAEECANQVLGI